MKDAFPVLTTNRFKLRQITTNDLESVYKGLSHPEVIKYYGVSYDSLESTKEQMQWYEQLETNNTGIWWAICFKNNNTFLGAIGLNDVCKTHNKAEIGFWLFPEYWKQGIIQEVAPTIINYAFSTLKVHRIEAYVEVKNQASKKTLKKLCFNYEDCMTDCEIKNGNYLSLEIYSLINKKSLEIIK